MEVSDEVVSAAVVLLQAVTCGRCVAGQWDRCGTFRKPTPSHSTIQCTVLLLSDSMDRNAGTGFRCVSDANHTL